MSRSHTNFLTRRVGQLIACQILTPLFTVLSSDEERVRNGKIIRWSIGVSLMLILSVIVFCFWKRRQKQAKSAETPIGK